MEIEVLNRETVRSIRRKPPTVQINKKGQVRFSCEAVCLLQLDEGDKVEFLIHRADPGIIYFTKSDTGFELKKEVTRGGQTRLLVLCRPLLIKLCNHFSLQSNTTFDITNETSKFYDRDCWFILKEKKHIPIKWRS